MLWVIRNTTEFNAVLTSSKSKIPDTEQDLCITSDDGKTVVINLSPVPFECYIAIGSYTDFNINPSTDWEIEEQVSILTFDEMTVTIDTKKQEIEIF